MNNAWGALWHLEAFLGILVIVQRRLNLSANRWLNLKLTNQVMQTVIFPRFNGHQYLTDKVSNAKIHKAKKTWQYSNEFKVNAALLSLMKVLKLKKSLSWLSGLKRTLFQHSSTPALQH
jgi:hypothetical protein